MNALAFIQIGSERLMITLVTLPTFLLSLTLHEYAHARTALAFGDTTARDQGRVSLNPLVHLDPFGTIVLIVTGMFGWARPVPVNPYRLDPPRLGNLMVSLAGPMSNLALAGLCAAGLHLVIVPLTRFGGASLANSVTLLLSMTLVANVGLAVFNMIPLYPLDGHHVVRELLPSGHERFMLWQIRYGRPALLGLLVGPRLLSIALQRDVFDPIGYLYREAIDLALRLTSLQWG